VSGSAWVIIPAHQGAALDLRVNNDGGDTRGSKEWPALFFRFWLRQMRIFPRGDCFAGLVAAALVEWGNGKMIAVMINQRESNIGETPDFYRAWQCACWRSLLSR
jgi:hypothetical protein